MVKIRVANSQAYELAGSENKLEMASISSSSKEVPRRHHRCWKYHLYVDGYSEVLSKSYYTKPSLRACNSVMGGGIRRLLFFSNLEWPNIADGKKSSIIIGTRSSINDHITQFL